MWPFALRYLSPDGPSGPAPGPGPALAPFFDATADAMLVYGPDFIVVAANEAAGRLLREQRGRLRGRSVLESPLLARLLAAASVPQRLQDDTDVVRDEVTVADVEGQPLQCRLEALRQDDGRVLLHLQDTTPALRAVAALRSIEELHRAASAVLPGVTWTMALPEERLVDVSPAVERLFGYEPAALLQRPELWGELAHPGDRARIRADPSDDEHARRQRIELRRFQRDQARLFDLRGTAQLRERHSARFPLLAQVGADVVPVHRFHH
jgi:PAS domain-containing protein